MFHDATSSRKIQGLSFGQEGAIHIPKLKGYWISVHIQYKGLPEKVALLEKFDHF